jgi:hypothetical protein
MFERDALSEPPRLWLLALWFEPLSAVVVSSATAEPASATPRVRTPAVTPTIKRFRLANATFCIPISPCVIERLMASGVTQV